MKVLISGRLVAPADGRAALRFADRNLHSIHRRSARARALVLPPRLPWRRAELPALPALALAGQVGGAARDWLALTDYADSARERTIVFLFDGRSQPTVVVKVRPIPSAGTPLANEAEILDSLASQLPPPLRATVPRVEAFEIHGPYEVLAVTGLPGVPLSISMQRSLRPCPSHARHLAAAAHWLGAMHQATEHDGNVLVHGDLWPRNVLFESPAAVAGVVDWERGALSGSRWRDLFTLPLLFLLRAPVWRERSPDAVLRNVLWPDSGEGAIFARYIRAYQIQTGIGNEAIAEGFDQFLAGLQNGRGKEDGWAVPYRWEPMRTALRTPRRSVFSG